MAHSSSFPLGNQGNPPLGPIRLDLRKGLPCCHTLAPFLAGLGLVAQVSFDSEEACLGCPGGNLQRRAVSRREQSLEIVAGSCKEWAQARPTLCGLRPKEVAKAATTQGPWPQTCRTEGGNCFGIAGRVLFQRPLPLMFQHRDCSITERRKLDGKTMASHHDTTRVPRTGPPSNTALGPSVTFLRRARHREYTRTTM